MVHLVIGSSNSLEELQQRWKIVVSSRLSRLKDEPHLSAFPFENNNKRKMKKKKFRSIPTQEPIPVTARCAPRIFSANTPLHVPVLGGIEIREDVDDLVRIPCDGPVEPGARQADHEH